MHAGGPAPGDHVKDRKLIPAAGPTVLLFADAPALLILLKRAKNDGENIGNIFHRLCYTKDK